MIRGLFLFWSYAEKIHDVAEMSQMFLAVLYGSSHNSGPVSWNRTVAFHLDE